MTPEQIQAFRDTLSAGKVAPEKVSPEWPYQRAWNDGIAFAELQLDRVMKGETAA